MGETVKYFTVSLLSVDAEKSSANHTRARDRRPFAVLTEREQSRLGSGR